MRRLGYLYSPSMTGLSKIDSAAYRPLLPLLLVLFLSAGVMT